MTESVLSETVQGVSTFDGRFMFTGITPGRYSVIARAFPRVMGGDAAAAPREAEISRLWAVEDVVVSGEDIPNLALTLQPALKIAGRVVFEGSRSAAPFSARLPLPLALGIGNLAVPLPAIQLEADETFTIDGVVPGPYRFHTAFPGVRTPVGKWWLKSIVAGGRDLLDAPIEIRQNITDAVATFSDQTSELAGRVTDGNGSAVSGQLVVVFSTDKTTWFPNSRRVAGIRSSADGRYAVSNLPPGDYFVALSNEVEQGDRIDPLTLDTLVAGASRVSIGVNEKKQQDLLLAERVPRD